MTGGLAHGIAAALAANLIWGLSPLFYKALAHVPTLEVLCHRTLWSVVFFGLVLLASGRLHRLGEALGNPRMFAAAAFSASMVGINWFVFIWSIQHGRAVEASFGYYIFPLVSVVFGIVFFREGLDAARLLSFVLAFVAVCVLTLGLGAVPYISVILAITSVPTLKHNVCVIY